MATVRRERIVELLNTMTPAQIADIIEILPRVEADPLLSVLLPDTANKVAELLSRHEIRLPTIATGHFLAMPETATVGDALNRFRDQTQRYDVIMYVYVVTEEGLLRGVIDIRELIQARPEEILGSIMTEQIVTLSPQDTLADAAREFAKYGFRALPMVDQQRKLIGVVRHKDLLAVEE